MEDESKSHSWLRLLLLLFALSAAWAYMVSDENRFAQLEKGADAILDRIPMS
jgi:hypothetical protein